MDQNYLKFARIGQNRSNKFSTKIARGHQKSAFFKTKISRVIFTQNFTRDLLRPVPVKKIKKSQPRGTPLNCKHCPFVAKDSYQLRKHSEQHNRDAKDFPFICAYENCDAKFKASSTRNIHEKTIHKKILSEKIMYSCGQCKMKTMRIADYRKHLKIHVKDDSKTFKCSHCDAWFAGKHNLCLHEQYQH